MSTSRRHETVTRQSPADEAISRLATAQHGVVSREQLRRLGLGPAAIDHRLRTGRLLSLHRGVYAVGHRPASQHARAMAAVLACGHGAALSHRSAAALWRVGLAWPDVTEVTARSGRAHRGVRVHRSCTIEATHEYGIAVTTPARTLLDLAPVLDDATLVRAVNEARLANRLGPNDLAAMLARAPRRLRRLVMPGRRADTIRVRGRVPALRPPLPAASPGGQSARGGLRGRHAVASAAPDRRARRPQP